MIRLSREALLLAAPSYEGRTAGATLADLERRGLVGRKPQRVHCLHLHAIPEELRVDLGKDLDLKDLILESARLLVRPQDEEVMCTDAS